MKALKLVLTILLALTCFALKAQVIPVNMKNPPAKKPLPPPVAIPEPGKKQPAAARKPKHVARQQPQPEEVAYTPPVTPPVPANKYDFNFFDSFYANTGNAWSLVSDDKKEITINNSKFRIRGISSQYGYRSTRNFEINPASDFAFSVNTSWLAGVTNEPLGVDYCGNITDDAYYNFSITANGYYIIRSYQNGKWTDVKEWTKSGFINQNTVTNALALKKEGVYLSFFINGQQVERLRFNGSYGNAFGLRAEGVQTVDFDNFALNGMKQSAQLSYTPPANDSRFSLTEAFYDNSNKWPLTNGANKEMKIENGKLRIRGIADGYSYDSSRDFDINNNNDFDLSVSAKWITGISNRAIGLVYCANTAFSSYHSFAISADGSYLIAYYNNSTWTNKKDRTESSYIKKNATNVLSVKKQGNYITYYINGQQVESLPFDGGYGNVFGVRVGGAQTVDFDDFTLSGAKASVIGYTPPATGSTFNLLDNFYDNKNAWPLADDAERQMTVSNGKLRIRGISNEKSYKTTRAFEIDISKDFTFAVTAKWIEGIKTKAFGMVYCGSTAFTTHCDFTISANGSYTITYYDGDNWKNVKAWTKSDFINQDAGENVLSIKKQGSTISFFINEHQVESIPFDGGYGNVFGLRAEGTQTIDFDNFKLNGSQKQ